MTNLLGFLLSCRSYHLTHEICRKVLSSLLACKRGTNLGVSFPFLPPKSRIINQKWCHREHWFLSLNFQNFHNLHDFLLFLWEFECFPSRLMSFSSRCLLYSQFYLWKYRVTPQLKRSIIGSRDDPISSFFKSITDLILPLICSFRHEKNGWKF